MSDRDIQSTKSAWDVPKVRRCLRCQETFASQWSGERICPRCKKTKAWRTDTPYGNGAFVPMGGSRK